jgi:hypothetical protein
MEPKNKDKDNDAEPYSGWWLPAIAALGSILCALLFFVSDWTSGRNGIEKLGQMGDFFGGILNPLVSALTLFVAISVWQLQKKELKATQKALDEQAKTAEQQRQEQRFFDLLNVYQRTVDSITFASQMNQSPVQHTGKGAIAELYRNNASSIKDFDANGLHPATNHFPDQTNNDLKRIWNHETIAPLFDHYFRVIFHILTEAETLLGDQNTRYIQLFRAQLSRTELIILGFNLWLNDESLNMIPLAEKYGLLKHLPTGHLRTELENLHPKVFGHQPEATL